MHSLGGLSRCSGVPLAGFNFTLGEFLGRPLGARHNVSTKSSALS